MAVLFRSNPLPVTICRASLASEKSGSSPEAAAGTIPTSAMTAMKTTTVLQSG
jgi:hypothetical protein